MRVFKQLTDIAHAEGQDLGVSTWLPIEQQRIDQFAEATNDFQWIHVDAERAAAGPFGAPIAHGYLTLSLIPYLGSQVFTFDTPGPRLNYGINKVRFPQPVLVGSRVRARVQLRDVDAMPRGMQVTMRFTLEIEGSAKPACVAETLVLLLG